jgi:chromate transporter
VNLTVLLAILLKASLLSFSGFGALPVLRDELVTNRHVLTTDDLNRAVAVARVTPGPMGIYVVAVGYAVSGWPGAVAGWLSLTLPALLAVPLIIVMRRHAQSPRAREAIDAVMLASAALVLSTARALIPTAVVDVPTAIVAVAALVVVFGTRVSTVWVIAGGAVATLLF